jgi:geranylgeranyl reductase family protein
MLKMRKIITHHSPSIILIFPPTMTDPLSPEYDFLVIGAGPAGLLAALTLVREPGSRSVALIDKRDPWREPVSCAEAVHRKRIESLVPAVEPAWVRGPVDGAIFVAPDGTEVRFGQAGSGYLIDRALMHRRLAEQAREGGAHCNFRARATGISRLENGRRTVTYETAQGPGTISARVVIDCSGPGTGFGAGENITQGNFDVEPAVFALVKGLKYPTNYIQMFFGTNYAPGGYAWLFPRDGEVANVGLVVGRDYAHDAPARQALKTFIEKTYPGAEVLSFQGGAIPCGYPDSPLAADNLYKAGDAANMVHPLSRAGITESMTGGKYAALAALKTIDMPDEAARRKVYAEYKAAWDDAYGKAHRRIAGIKKAFMRVPDATFNKAARAISKLPPEKQTMTRIFLTTLWQSPTLLWQMRSLFLKG